MVKIVLKPKFRKLRDEARSAIAELQEARREAAGPNQTPAIAKKAKELEIKVTQVSGVAALADSKDVEEHRVSAWVGADKPYELATDNATNEGAKAAEAAMMRVARQALDEDFYKVGDWQDAKLKFAFIALGGKGETTREAAVKFVEDKLDNMAFAD